MPLGKRLASQIHYLPRLWDHDLAFGQPRSQFLLEPGSRWLIAVNKNNGFWIAAYGVVGNLLAWGMTAEIEATDLALNRSFVCMALAQLNPATLSRSKDFASGCLTVGVADEKQGVIRFRENAPCEAIRNGVLRHHSAGESIDSAPVKLRFAMSARKNFEIFKVFEDFEVTMVSGFEVGKAIRDARHACAEPADVDGNVGDHAFVP